MTPLRDFLSKVERGDHPYCHGCPWNPKDDREIAFGTSCRKHGVDWKSSTTAVSVQITQDPGNTTPQESGRLCSIHNSQNPTDWTAQHALDLWNAGVSRDSPYDPGPYLKDHYWTNAVMHGATKAFQRNTLNRARKHCMSVLLEQIEILSPTVVIACGTAAVRSLHESGVIKTRWKQFRGDLSRRAYRESITLFSGSEATIFCTYHTSFRGVISGAAKLHSDDTETLLQTRVDQLGRPASTTAFLAKYSKSATRGKGMRVLLLHWLDIGDAIRACRD
jgi:hypothetical protein